MHGVIPTAGDFPTGLYNLTQLTVLSLADNAALTGKATFPNRHLDLLDISGTGLSELPSTFPPNMSFTTLITVSQRAHAAVDPLHNGR